MVLTLCSGSLLYRGSFVGAAAAYPSGADRGTHSDDRRPIRAHLTAPVEASRTRDRRLIGGYRLSAPLSAFFGAVVGLLLGGTGRCGRAGLLLLLESRLPPVIRGSPRPPGAPLLKVFRL